MKRKTVIAAINAYRNIKNDVEYKLRFAEEVAGDGEKYRQEAAELLEVKQEIIRILNTIPVQERNAVWYHYFQRHTWAWVALKCAYSERQIRNIGNKGLDRLAAAFSKSPQVAAFCEHLDRTE